MNSHCATHNTKNDNMYKTNNNDNVNNRSESNVDKKQLK